MEIYNIGAKVQAVDERGRWENGKIVNIREDGAGGQLFTVKFDGWPAMFNQDVDRSGLRNRVSPGAVGHGELASCAIDTLIEIFHFCIYKNDHYIRASNSDAPVATELLRISRYRDLKGHVNCSLRQRLWNCLVGILPMYFAPKGTINAHTFPAFQEMMSEFPEKFQFTVTARESCMVCNKDVDRRVPYTNIVTLSMENLEKGSHIVQNGIGHQLERTVKHDTSIICPTCQSQQRIDNSHLAMAEFMIVEIPVHNDENLVDVVIHESMNILGNTYELVGTVMKQPQHFFTIVKDRHNSAYLHIDDMKEEIGTFGTFSGAVKRNKNISSHIHKTSKFDDAVFLLILQHSGGSRQVPYQIMTNLRGTKTMVNFLTTYPDQVQPVPSSSSTMHNPPATPRLKPASGKALSSSGTLPPPSTPAMSNLLSNMKPTLTPTSRNTTSRRPAAVISTPGLKISSGKFPSRSGIPPPPSTSATSISSANMKPNMTPASRSTIGTLVSAVSTPWLKPASSKVSSRIGTLSSPSTSAVSNTPPNRKPTMTPTSRSTTSRWPAAVITTPGLKLASGKVPTHNGILSRSGIPSPPSTSATSISSSNMKPNLTPTSRSATGTLVSAVTTPRLKPTSSKAPSPSGVTSTPTTPALSISPSTVKQNLTPTSTCRSTTSRWPATTVSTPRLKPAASSKDPSPSGIPSSPSTSAKMSTPDLKPVPVVSCKVGSPSGPWILSSPDQHGQRKSMKKHASSQASSPSASGKWNIHQAQSALRKKTSSKSSGTMQINKADVRYVKNNKGELYLHCKDLWFVSGLDVAVVRKGYKRTLDPILAKEGIQKDSAFLFSAQKNRDFVKLDAALTILGNWKGRGTWKRQSGSKLKAAKEDLLALAREKTKSLTFESSNHQRQSGRRKPHVKYSTSRSRNAKCKTGSSYNYRMPIRYLKKVLFEIYLKKCKGNRRTLMESLSSLFRSTHYKKFSGYISKKDLTIILSGVPAGVKGHKAAKNMLEDIAIDTFHTSLRMSPEDLINILETSSGFRLANNLRKCIPAGIPAKVDHVATQKRYNLEFSSVLLPRRTPTGWEVSICRLIQVLKLRYPWLSRSRPIHWKIYGDGREIAGKQSTFVAINLLNNEAALHDVLFQSPGHVYPVNIFFESDSRDNLEENLGYPVSRLDGHIETLQENGDHVFSLSADYMFLIAILDGDKCLGATSENGWSFYREGNKSQKQDVTAAGFRTDLDLAIDRVHPSSLLPSVPLKNTVFCLLHGQARSMERLLALVLSDIAAEANRLAQQANAVDPDGYKARKISTLENNINLCGVRQGKFRFLFDKCGKPEQVTLNKDHAYAILSPGSAGQPHCLKNVLSVASKVKNNKPDTVNARLHLQNEYSVADLVQSIWNHFYEMVTILREDKRSLEDGCEDGSKEGSDYLWGYTETDVENYVLHAESFYQLFTLRYGADKLTPYMMMFIDQAPKLMTILPFPISRYESEAGEHTNYDHSRFTFQHTTRGGGHGKPDTILPLFRRMWKSISHSITSNADKDEESRKAAAKFDELVFQHVAAVEIQRRVRGYLTRKALQRHTKWTPRVSLSKCDDKMRQQQLCQNSKALKELGFAEERVPHDELFRHSVFVLCGSVPKTMGKLKQADIEKMIRANGGRVKNSLPTSLKGVSTKKYIVLVDQLFVGAKKKMPLAVRHAIEGNHHVLKFAYVVDSVKEQQVKDKLAYAHDVSSISATMTQRVPLKQHFSRSLGTGASYIKKSRKRKRGQPTHQKKQEGKTKKKEYKSACQLYALRNVEFQGVKKFEERGQWIGFFTKKWTTLNNEEKLPYVTEWNQSRKNDNDKQ